MKGLTAALLIFAAHGAAAQNWAPMQPWSITRRMCTINFAYGGRGYIGTGHDHNTKYPFGDLGIYDPVTDAWTAEVDLDIPKRTCAFSFVSGDWLYTGGGTRDSGRTALRDFYRIRLTDFRTDTLASLPLMHANGSKAHLSGDTAYVVGGCDAAGCEGVLWQYDIAARQWSAADSLYVQAAFGTSFIAGGRLYYGGGSKPGASVDNRLFCFDPTTATTREQGLIPPPARTMGIAVSLNDSEAVAGMGFAYNLFLRSAGQGRGGPSWRQPAPVTEAECVLDDLWKFDARSGSWTKLKRFPDRRRNASVFVLGSRLYIMQGNDFHGASKGGYSMLLN